MSYLSTKENVGFSGASDTSCATQYKMAVDGVSANCSSDLNMFIHDGSADEQVFVPHPENFFHNKFKIDASELYTFNDSDIVAGEITVSHTEDFGFHENIDIKEKDNEHMCANGDLQIKEEPIINGHYEKSHLSTSSNIKIDKLKSSKNHKIKAETGKDKSKVNASSDVRRTSVKSSNDIKRLSIITPSERAINSSTILEGNSHAVQPPKVSINSNNVKNAGLETFLDVFKREHGLNEQPVVKIESPPSPPAKLSITVAKKILPIKPTPPKSRKGRGPIVHEALQRISFQKKAIPIFNKQWHAPGDELFDCGPLGEKTNNAFRQLESSSDDDNMPDIESGNSAVCAEETAAETRTARLALRRASLRRHVARASATLRLKSDFTEYKALTSIVKKQINRKHASSIQISSQVLNYVLAVRGMPQLLSSKEKRALRETGWSGGESGLAESSSKTCTEPSCNEDILPCSKYCAKHVTLSAEQRLYASCCAVFADGKRCKQSLFTLKDQTPLCPEHAWKRDNYEVLRQESRPRSRPQATTTAAPRQAMTSRNPASKKTKRRRRPPPRSRPQPQPQAQPLPKIDSATVVNAALRQGQTLSEINVCSNSSTYDSAEDGAIGGLSETEYIVAANDSNDLEVGEVGQVPPDDILDTTVLNQIPDEAFTEFFNQAEGGTFAESSELAAALEAVLEERALDNIAEVVFPQHNNKIHVPSPVTMEMSSSTPS